MEFEEVSARAVIRWSTRFGIILGAICSYPLSAFYYGNAGVSLFTYIPAFMISTCFGTLCAVILLKFMKKAGVLRKLQGEAEGETIK